VIQLTVLPGATDELDLLRIHSGVLVVDPTDGTALVGVGRDGRAGSGSGERVVTILPPATIEDKLAELVGGVLVVDAESLIFIITNAGELGVGGGFEVVADAESTIVPASSGSSFVDALQIT
jgi:hypothetical protein